MLANMTMKKKTKITDHTRDNTFLVGESTFQNQNSTLQGSSVEDTTVDIIRAAVTDVISEYSEGLFSSSESQSQMEKPKSESESE